MKYFLLTFIGILIIGISIIAYYSYQFSIRPESEHSGKDFNHFDKYGYSVLSFYFKGYRRSSFEVLAKGNKYTVIYMKYSINVFDKRSNFLDCTSIEIDPDIYVTDIKRSKNFTLFRTGSFELYKAQGNKVLLVEKKIAYHQYFADGASDIIAYIVVEDGNRQLKLFDLLESKEVLLKGIKKNEILLDFYKDNILMCLKERDENLSEYLIYNYKSDQYQRLEKYEVEECVPTWLGDDKVIYSNKNLEMYIKYDLLKKEFTQLKDISTDSEVFYWPSSDEIVTKKKNTPNIKAKEFTIEGQNGLPDKQIEINFDNAKEAISEIPVSIKTKQ